MLAVPEKRRVVAGVAVDDRPGGFELAIKERDELRRQCRMVDDAVQLLERRGYAQVFFDAHAQADDRVPCLERGRQAVARRVGHRDAQAPLGDTDEVIEIAADFFRGDRSREDVVVAERRRCGREQRELDRPRLGEPVGEFFAAQLQVDRVPDRVERVADLFGIAVFLEREGNELPGPLSDADRRESLDAERGFDLGVDACVSQAAIDVSLFDQLANRRVSHRDLVVLRSARHRVLALQNVHGALLVVDATADESEIVLKIVDEPPQDFGECRDQIARSFDRAEIAVDLAEEVLVVHRNIPCLAAHRTKGGAVAPRGRVRNHFRGSIR